MSSISTLLYEDIAPPDNPPSGKYSWPTKSSYCGEDPPSHLNEVEVINWLVQKTERKPCLSTLSAKENERRIKERWEMRMLAIRLRLARIKEAFA